MLKTRNSVVHEIIEYYLKLLLTLIFSQEGAVRNQTRNPLLFLFRN